MNKFCRPGFTLVELLTTITIAVIIMGLVAFSAYSLLPTNQMKTLVKSRAFIAEQLQRYYEIQVSQHPGTEYDAWPQTVDEFRNLFLKNTQYFGRIPVNPFADDSQNPENGWDWDFATKSLYALDDQGKRITIYSTDGTPIDASVPAPDNPASQIFYNPGTRSTVSDPMP